MPISALEARALHDSIRFTHLDRGHCWSTMKPPGSRNTLSKGPRNAVRGRLEARPGREPGTAMDNPHA
ncbi:hypothetical protein HBH98_161170 [Parastagonospora nodorum]|uniref:Uncharacterized protein n=1 Tax=Phaeosphaeria nodorum (strain SN15 / ATCC MYA-4574 / FGSC 10173) TaxID=321614 RepID=A0A7U2I5Z5_PHANO|nr:hypothetical protein HBH53_039140 [Parastagonospora nodorum]QRD00618.1 hypothetical protein JI435_438400 [Parastagonospora nodorum SN15]KAH3976260.1 hypothetical protein HBH52_119340 [Parastagonospora nodorum]KAH3984343.1 hypothetical protein HBH51_029300 [Parastagonospora nodorum]KAH4036607.1 hypothetical protein HBI09_075070 [Parastagonospora nodorum]